MKPKPGVEVRQANHAPWVDAEKLWEALAATGTELPFQRAIVDRMIQPEEIHVAGSRRSGKTTQAVALLLADPNSVLMTFSAGERARIIREFKLPQEAARRVKCCDNELRGLRPTKIIYDDIKPASEVEADRRRAAKTAENLKKVGYSIHEFAAAAGTAGQAMQKLVDIVAQPVVGDPTVKGALDWICRAFGYAPHEVVGWVSYREFDKDWTVYEIDVGNGVPIEHVVTDQEIERGEL